MKTLYLMRHAKSAWDDLQQPDVERPLLETGLKRTRRVIEFLQKKDTELDLILTSHAVRAIETARIIAHAFSLDEQHFKIEKGIYHSNADDWMDFFYDIPEDAHRLLMVGHNPAITNFANHFLKEKIDYLTTSGIIVIRFKVNEWSEIAFSNARKVFVVAPKDFK